MRVIGIVALAIPVTGNWLHETLRNAAAQHYGFSSSEEHYASAAAFRQFTASNKQIFTDTFGLSSEQFNESANKFALVNGLESMTALINEADPTLLDSVKTSASPTPAQIRHVVELIESKIQDEPGIFSNSVSLPMYTLAVGVYHYGQSTTQLEYIMEGGNANVQFSAAIISNELSGTVLGSTRVTGSDSVSMTLDIVSDSTSGVVETISASVDFGGSAFVQLHIDESAAVNFGLKGAVGKSLFVITTDGTGIIVPDPLTIAVDNQSNALVAFDIAGHPIGQIQSIAANNETTPFLLVQGTVVTLSGPLQTQLTVSILDGTLSLSESAKFVVGQAPASQTIRADILGGITGMTNNLSFFGAIIVGGEITTSFVGSIGPNSLTVTGIFGDVQVSGSESTVELAQLISTALGGITFAQTTASGESQSSSFQSSSSVLIVNSDFSKPSTVIVLVFFGPSGDPVVIEPEPPADVCLPTTLSPSRVLYNCNEPSEGSDYRPGCVASSTLDAYQLNSAYVYICSQTYTCGALKDQYTCSLSEDNPVGTAILCAEDPSGTDGSKCNGNSQTPYYCYTNPSDNYYRMCVELDSITPSAFFDCVADTVTDDTPSYVCSTEFSAAEYNKCYTSTNNHLFGCTNGHFPIGSLVECDEDPQGSTACEEGDAIAYYCYKIDSEISDNYEGCYELLSDERQTFDYCSSVPQDDTKPLVVQSSPSPICLNSYFDGSISVSCYRTKQNNENDRVFECLKNVFVLGCGAKPNGSTACTQTGNKNYFCYQNSSSGKYQNCSEIASSIFYGCGGRPNTRDLITGSDCEASDLDPSTSEPIYDCYYGLDAGALLDRLADCVEVQSNEEYFFDCSSSPTRGVNATTCDYDVPAVGKYYSCFTSIEPVPKLYGCTEQADTYVSSLHSCNYDDPTCGTKWYCLKPSLVSNEHEDRECYVIASHTPTTYYACSKKPRNGQDPFDDTLADCSSTADDQHSDYVYDCYAGAGDGFAGKVYGCVRVQSVPTYFFDCPSKPAYGSLISGTTCKSTVSTGDSYLCYESFEAPLKFSHCFGPTPVTGTALACSENPNTEDECTGSTDSDIFWYCIPHPATNRYSGCVNIIALTKDWYMDCSEEPNDGDDAFYCSVVDVWFGYDCYHAVGVAHTLYGVGVYGCELAER